MPSEPRDYLIFRLGPQEFALPAGIVQEVRTAQDLTAANGYPGPACGEVRIRGNAVPVFSLHRRLGVAVESPPTPRWIVVLALRDRFARPYTAALGAESVSEVLSLAPAQFKPCDEAVHRAIVGRVRIKGRIKLILDPASLFDSHEQSHLTRLSPLLSAAV
ncbi:MAG: chemotaxis protein CheW [Bryobacteraceae bacterium]